MNRKLLLLSIGLFSYATSVSHSSVVDTVIFGKPFLDSILLENKGNDTAHLTKISFERLEGDESGLAIEFAHKSAHYAVMVDGGTLTSLWDGYQEVSKLAIPPGDSVALSRINFGKAPLNCTCEDALASHPSPHLFKVTFHLSNEAVEFISKGNIYVRPTNTIRMEKGRAEVVRKKMYEVNGRALPPALNHKPYVQIGN